jgi:hypothetical protein
MDLPFNLTDSTAKAGDILKDSIELERRRRQLAIETGRLLKRVQELKSGDERFLIQGWVTELLEDLR